MLLSAVSVLVVAQSSSEIPEGLMNNPIYHGEFTVARTTLFWYLCNISMFELLAVPQRGIPYVQVGPKDLNLKMFGITGVVDMVVAQTGYWTAPHPFTWGRRPVQFQQVYAVCLSWTTVVMLNKCFFVVGLNNESVCAWRSMLALHALRKCRRSCRDLFVYLYCTAQYSTAQHSTASTKIVLIICKKYVGFCLIGHGLSQTGE